MIKKHQDNADSLLNTISFYLPPSHTTSSSACGLLMSRREKKQRVKTQTRLWNGADADVNRRDAGRSRGRELETRRRTQLVRATEGHDSVNPPAISVSGRGIFNGPRVRGGTNVPERRRLWTADGRVRSAQMRPHRRRFSWMMISGSIKVSIMSLC